ncbi:MAG TPA: hypothetical protein VGG61_14095 [Gemmataceae bacterium]
MRWPVIGAISGAAVGLGLAVWCYVVDPVAFKISPSFDLDYLGFLAAVSCGWILLGAFAGVVLGFVISLLWKDKAGT